MKKRKYNSRASQAGFNLIELMVGLAIVGLVIAAAVWRMNKSYNSNDIQDTVAAVTSVATSARELRTTTGYGTSGTNLVTQLEAQDGIPSVWPLSSSVPQNAWGGTVTITSNVTGINIGITKIPEEACNKLSTRLSRNSYFSTTKINSTTYTGEVTSANAVSSCTSGSTNTLTWTTAS